MANRRLTNLTWSVCLMTTGFIAGCGNSGEPAGEGVVRVSEPEKISVSAEAPKDSGDVAVPSDKPSTETQP